MYQRNADGISIQVKAVLARAFERLERAGRKELPSSLSPDEIGVTAQQHCQSLARMSIRTISKHGNTSSENP